MPFSVFVPQRTSRTRESFFNVSASSFVRTKSKLLIESNFSLCKVIERAGIESLPNAVVMLFKNSSAFTPLCSVTTALFSSLIYTPYEMLI